MRRNSQRLVLIGLFTLAIVVLVNLAWWNYYRETSGMLDRQLARRLSAAAMTTSVVFPDSLASAEALQQLHSYSDAFNRLEAIRTADSLAELFLLSEDFTYLISTATETDSDYLLKRLNGPILDSLFYDLTEGPLVSPLYQSGELTLRTAFAPIRDSNGFVIAVIGAEAPVDYFQDLAVLRQRVIAATLISIAGSLLLGILFLYAQRRINRAEQQLVLSQTHAYLGRLVAVVSHELKNPLMILRGSAERIKRKTDLPEAGYLIEEVDRLGAIVAGYLDFAKAGDSLLGGDQQQQFDLIPLIAEIRDQFMKRSNAEATSWLELSSPNSLSFSGYPRALRQVILNLLLNGADACRAVPGESTAITLGIGVVDLGNRIRIDVVDRGIGMSPEELTRARAFEPFVTGKETGTGLGLYLTKKIVGEMGGSVELASKQHEGTTISLLIPK